MKQLVEANIAKRRQNLDGSYHCYDPMVDGCESLCYEWSGVVSLLASSRVSSPPCRHVVLCQFSSVATQHFSWRWLFYLFNYLVPGHHQYLCQVSWYQAYLSSEMACVE